MARRGVRMGRRMAIHAPASSFGPVLTRVPCGAARQRESAMTATGGIQNYYSSKIEELEVIVRERTANLRRLEAQRNELNAKVRHLREELSLLQEPGSYVGELVAIMGRKKVLVKVRETNSMLSCEAVRLGGSRRIARASHCWMLPVDAAAEGSCCRRKLCAASRPRARSHPTALPP